MSWIYSEAGLSIFGYGLASWFAVFVASKWVQRKPMDQRSWKDGVFVIVVFFAVIGILAVTFGLDTTGWR